MAEEKKAPKSVNKAPEFDLQELLEAGCHFGHKASKWHPKMAEYIYGEKDGVHLFDLVKTAEQLTIAYNMVYNLAKEGKTFLMVGTKRQAKEIVRDAASDAGCFYITSRWMGGMLTNWNQISKSIKRMGDIREGLKTGRFDKYTKYERLQLDKEQAKLARFFEGVKGMKAKPDCIFVVDPSREDIVVTEANTDGVPVIALIDSNTDPRPVQVSIPANDDAVKSIKYIVDQLAAAYKAGVADRK